MCLILGYLCLFDGRISSDQSPEKIKYFVRTISFFGVELGLLTIQINGANLNKLFYVKRTGRQ